MTTNKFNNGWALSTADEAECKKRGMLEDFTGEVGWAWNLTDREEREEEWNDLKSLTVLIGPVMSDGAICDQHIESFNTELEALLPFAEVGSAESMHDIFRDELAKHMRVDINELTLDQAEKFIKDICENGIKAIAI